MNTKNKKRGIIISFTVAILFFAYIAVMAAVYTLDGTVISRSDLRQQPYESSTLQNYRLGARLVIDDKVYRYAKVGTKEGEVLSGFILVSNATTVEYNGTSDPGIAIISGAASETGDYYVAILDDLNKNDYQNALITITDVSEDPDQVWSTYVSTHDSTAAVYGSDTVLVTLLDPLPVTLTTSDYINITPNLYSDVVVSLMTDTTVRVAVGMSSVFNADSTDIAARYIWVQTWGPATGVYTGNAGGQIGERALYHTGLGKVEIADSLNVMFLKTTDLDSMHVNNLIPVGEYLSKTTVATDFTARSPIFLRISP